MNNNKQKGWILGLIIFIMGGCGIAYEYTFSKVASDLLGNSTQQWAIVIALMLFCMGIGAEIQKAIKNDHVVSSLLYSQILLSLLGGFGPLLLLYVFSAYPLQFGLINYGIISIIGILIGFEIPLISRLNENYSNDIGSNLARVLKMDYIGALVGALVWVFILPKFFSLSETAYILGFISLAASIICWSFFKRQSASSYIFLVAVTAATASLAWGYKQVDGWSAHAEQKLFLDPIVLNETSQYQHMIMTQNRYGTVRCYINGHIQFSSDDEYIYHEMLVHPVMALAGKAKRVLVLGGGDGLAVREILKYNSVKEVVLVDLDPMMTTIARKNPLMTKLNDNSLNSPKVAISSSAGITPGKSYALNIPNQRRVSLKDKKKPTPKLHIINVDAANYIKKNIGTFDIIICDFPDPSSNELSKLYSLHFYGELKKHLAPDGYMIQQSTSPFRAKEAFLCIGRTIRAADLTAVPLHDHVPSFGEWGWWVATHKSIQSEKNLKKSLSSITNLEVNTTYLTPQLIRSSLFFGKANLQTSEVDITTITQPSVLNYYLEGWKE